MIKKGLLILGLLIVLFVLTILGFIWRDANGQKYDNTIDEKLIPIFSKIDFPFEHKYSNEKSLPIAPAAVIDIDNDGVEEVFMGGGLLQNDKILKFEDNAFIDITSKTALPAKGDFTSLAAATADFDNNQFQDLIVSREDGLHLYYNTDGVFTHKHIRTPLNDLSTPAGISLGDIDQDGDIDIFLSAYIKKDKMQGQTIFEDKSYGATSELLLNDGNDNFVSITKNAGLDYVHNTFMAILIDVDEDGDLDLVVAHDTGEVRTYKNNGDLTFTMIENPTTNKFAYPMGIAVGDYDNNGLIDFAFSNSGSTLPRFLAKGDIKDESKFNEKYILFKNNGDFNFSDMAEQTKIADYEFSWGMVFADMNNDGLQDLMVAENYVDLLPNKIFRLPSRMLIQKSDNTFVATESKSGVKNPHFAMTPLVSDFNKDGSLDMIWVNINSPSLAYINKKGTNNFISISLPKNAQNLGAIVKVFLPSGKILTDHLINGEGIGSDQTAFLHYGLGSETAINKIEIKLLNGTTKIITNPKINSTLKINSTSKTNTNLKITNHEKN